MAQQTLENSKQVEKDQWVGFCDATSDGNRGRTISLEVIDPESGDETPVESAPLSAIVCDPEGKGNDITIETGSEQVDYAHTVQAPTELWQAQDSNGKLMAIEIKGEDGSQVIIRFA